MRKLLIAVGLGLVLTAGLAGASALQTVVTEEHVIPYTIGTQTGEYTFTDEDTVSTVTETETITVTDTTPPPVADLTIVSPAQETTVSGNVELVAHDSRPNVDWVGFYPCDGNQSYEDHVSSDGTWSVIWDSTQCPNGRRNLGVFSFDNNGGQIDSVDEWWLVVDNVPIPPQPPPAPDCDPTSDPAPIAGQGYEMVFQDCFSALNSATWTDHQWWEPSPPAGSVAIEDGNLTITSKRSDGYPNVSVSSEPHGAGCPANCAIPGENFKYGYFEARVGWNAGPGTSPAFWLFSTAHATNPNWPQPKCANPNCLSAELDVVELYGSDPDVFTGTIHRNSCNCYNVPNEQNENNWQPQGENLSLDYHTYAALWTPTSVKWYLDGEFIMEAEPYDSFNQQMHMILYNWRGEWQAGNQIGPTSPDEFYTKVDWVRVWQVEEVPEPPEFPIVCTTENRDVWGPTYEPGECVYNATITVTPSVVNNGAAWRCAAPLATLAQNAGGSLPLRVIVNEPSTRPVGSISFALDTGCNGPGGTAINLMVESNMGLDGRVSDPFKTRNPIGPQGIRMTGVLDASGPSAVRDPLDHQDCIQLQGGGNVDQNYFVNMDACGDYEAGISNTQGAGGAFFFSNNESNVVVLGGEFVGCNHSLEAHPNEVGPGMSASRIIDAKFRTIGPNRPISPWCFPFNGPGIPCSGAINTLAEFTNVTCQRWNASTGNWDDQ